MPFFLLVLGSRLDKCVARTGCMRVALPGAHGKAREMNGTPPWSGADLSV